MVVGGDGVVRAGVEPVGRVARLRVGVAAQVCEVALEAVALGLLAGGALSNLFDRLTQGYVTDFLHLANFPVFNLADT
ncbi:MAG: signal peptidase II, partial [Actinomycetota bacterium]